MVAFGHTAVGTLIGIGAYHYIGATNPELGLVIAGASGIASHYICDFIPHGHFIKQGEFRQKILWEIIFNLFFSILIFLGIVYYSEGFSLKFWYLFFGIAGAQSPDVLMGLEALKILPKNGLFRLEYRFHEAIHWHGKWKNGKLIEGLPWNFLKRDFWQILTFCLALFLLISK